MIPPIEQEPSSNLIDRKIASRNSNRWYIMKKSDRSTVEYKSGSKMEVEAVIIAADSNDIIFACHCLPPSKNWNEYIERLVKLIPKWDPPTPFLLFDDIAIGCLVLKDIRIIVTAPLTSNFAIEQVMEQAVDQIRKIVNYVAKEEPYQNALLKRDPFIHLQVLMQAEISASGHMRFGLSSDFANSVLI
jgi:hypothetical protein